MMTSMSYQMFFDRYERVKSIEHTKNELIEVHLPILLGFGSIGLTSSVLQI
jgi:hypothetical protein